MSRAQEHNTPSPWYHVGLSVYSPIGVEGSDDGSGHKRRAHALHRALKNVGGIEVTDWGATDASQPQWLVQIRVMLTPALAVRVSRPEPFRALSDALAAAGAASDLVDSVVAFVSHLRGLQSAKDLGAFELDLPDGNRVRCESRGSGAEFTVSSVTRDPVIIRDDRPPQNHPLKRAPYMR